MTTRTSSSYTTHTTTSAEPSILITKTGKQQPSPAPHYQPSEMPSLEQWAPLSRMSWRIRLVLLLPDCRHNIIIIGTTRMGILIRIPVRMGKRKIVVKMKNTLVFLMLFKKYTPVMALRVFIPVLRRIPSRLLRIRFCSFWCMRFWGGEGLALELGQEVKRGGMWFCRFGMN